MTSLGSLFNSPDTPKAPNVIIPKPPDNTVVPKAPIIKALPINYYGGRLVNDGGNFTLNGVAVSPDIAKPLIAAENQPTPTSPDDIRVGYGLSKMAAAPVLPKAPDLPPVPDPGDKQVQGAVADASRKRGLSKGFASTILGSALTSTNNGSILKSTLGS